jgi:hypothetical protein
MSERQISSLLQGGDGNLPRYAREIGEEIIKRIPGLQIV